jgi:Fanconi anemia group M protein
LPTKRAGAYNVLVTTSIGEEGLDIPEYGLVVFYEPAVSGIRYI